MYGSAFIFCYKYVKLKKNYLSNGKQKNFY